MATNLKRHIELRRANDDQKKSFTKSKTMRQRPQSSSIQVKLIARYLYFSTGHNTISSKYYQQNVLRDLKSTHCACSKMIRVSLLDIWINIASVLMCMLHFTAVGVYGCASSNYFTVG